MATTMQCRVLVAFAAIAVWLQPSNATADEGGGRAVAGVIVRIDMPEVVIDLGSAAGLATGMDVVLYRTIKARHPVTGKEVLDRFPIGKAVAEEVAQQLTILRPDSELAKLIRVGDKVVVRLAETPVAASAKPLAKPKPATCKGEAECPKCPVAAPCPTNAPCPTCPAVPPPVAADLAAVERTYTDALGLQPAERIALWKKFLRDFPHSSLRQAVEGELSALTQFLHASQLADRSARDQDKARAAATIVFHDALPELRIGEPAWLVFSAGDWRTVADLRVHWRQKGQATYALVRPEPTGRLIRRIAVPIEVWQPNGFDYFAVLTRIDGTVEHILGTAGDPHLVGVRDAIGSKVADPREGSVFRMVGEHVDFNRYVTDDWVVAAFADLTYRLPHDGVLTAFSMGYGVIAGVGGKVAEAGGDPSQLHLRGPNMLKPIAKDDTLAPKDASFKFAWLGGEWRLAPGFSGKANLVIGLGAQGLDSGIELAARIGQASGTNLQIGAATHGDLGRAAHVALQAKAFEKVPMTGIIEVTNRPVRADIGIRLIYELGFPIAKNIDLMGRVGYNLRTIVHAGFSFGGGLTFHW